MIKSVVSKDIDLSQYLALVDELDPCKMEYTIAHNPEIPFILNKTFGYEPKFVSYYKDSQLVATVPGCKFKGRFISVPHFSYGGVLKKRNVDLNFEEGIRNVSNKYEIRSFNKISDHFTDDKVTAYLILKDNEEDQHASFKYNIRRQIRVAKEKGVQIKMGKLDLLNDFYKVYCTNMSRLGSPPQPKKFFRNIIEGWTLGDAQIFCAYLDGKPIGGSFILSFRGVVENCWAATLWEYNKIYTPYLLYWELLRFSIQGGNKIFSFGRSSLNSGTLKFKNHWKPEIHPLYFCYSEHQNRKLAKNKFLVNICEKYIPEKVSTLAGKVLTKYFY